MTYSLPFKPPPYHRDGGRVSRAQIADELKTLKGFLVRPRSLAEMGTKFGWSERTATRRLHALGRVWRVTPNGERVAKYVIAPEGWK